MHRSSRDIICYSVLSCLWAMQAAVALQQLLGLWHPPLLLKDALLPEAVERMAPKWDMLIYLLFIAIALASGLVIFRFYRKPVNPWFLAFESVVTFLMVSAAFKLIVYDNSPHLAQWSLTALILIAILSKIFYPEAKRCVVAVFHRLNSIRWSPYTDVWWVLVIVLLIYMPDAERVIAMIYMGDWLHHFDFILMSPGWVSLCGHVPFVEYGLGLPAIFARLINAFGGFDYVPALRVMMWFVIIYFIFVYVVARCWLKSGLMAGVAFLLVFRLQMFHYGVSPLVWCTPSASPLRFGLDILWLAALLMHMRDGKSRWLVAAALYSGFAVYYMTSVGLCAMVTFYAYLTALAVFPFLFRPILADPSKRLWYFICWGLPLLSALLFFGAELKGLLLQRSYWHNLIDYMAMFERFGSLPMWESLKYRHFWAFFMSMVMLFTYVASLLYAGVCLYIEKGPVEELFPALLSIYGLANYQYYVVRSAITSYYVNALPFVFIACFWFMRALVLLPNAWQRRLKAAAVILSFYALLTNQNYLAYPNVINPSRNPMTDNLVIQRFPDRMGFFNNQYKNVKEQDKVPVNDLGTTQEDVRTEDDFKSDEDLKAYVRASFDFREDAALIDRLTKPGERAAVLSSFETKVLIQARRPPFFYHFCIFSSRPMTYRRLPYSADATRTADFLHDTIKEIEDRRPAYVFMEKVFLQDVLPSSYKEDNPEVTVIIDHVKARYAPFEYGKYLVAMKRKA